MFDKLKELMDEFEEPIKNKRVAKENRGVLQLIKVEAQRLRDLIQDNVKKGDYDKK